MSWSNKGFTACWLGHSTVLLNYYGTWILTDPVFATTIGLDFGVLGRVGLKRHAPLSIQVEDIPPIDMVLISHAHLDHLDVQSLEMLKNKRKTTVITSINTGSLIKPIHFRKVVELAWKEHFTINGLTIKAFSTKHFGARTPLDLDFNDDKKNGMGYNSYLVTTEGKAGFFFMGDTGFTRRFKSKIDSKIDLVLMPIGGYNPWGEKIHINPVQAIRMAMDIGAKKLMPIHWGTFAIGIEGSDEPINVLQEEVIGKQLEIIGIDRKPVIIKKSVNKSKPIDDPWEYKIPANYGLNPRLLAEYLNHEINITQFISQEWHVAKPKQFRTALLGIRNMIKDLKYPPVIVDNVIVCTRCRKAKRVRFYSHPNAPHSIALVCYECNNDLHNYYRLRPGGWELTKDEIVVDIERTDPKSFEGLKQQESKRKQKSIIIPHAAFKIKLKDRGYGNGQYNYEIHVNDDYAGHVEFNANPAGIYEIEIEKKYRRKGIADAVYQWIETKHFKGQDIELEIYASAQAFWEKMGYMFDHVEEYEDYLPSGKPYLIIMTKQA